MSDSSFLINEIPAKWASFVGRDAECNLLKELLNNSKNPVILVYGPRGVGKSSLVCYVTNELKDIFSSIVWVDRSNAQELFEEIRNSSVNYVGNEKKVSNNSAKSTTLKKSILEKKEANINLNSAIKALLGKSSNLPFLLVIDDFDEEYSLLERKNDDFILCRHIENFIKYPNKVILTSRLRENSFKELAYDMLEIGLLQKQDVYTLVKKHFEVLDKAVLFNENIEDTCQFIWDKSGGLAEFICCYIIPLTINREFLLGRDPELNNAIHEFSNCYLIERQQPRSVEGYQTAIGEQNLETLLISLFKDKSFAEFVLWKWFNLNLLDSYSENELGEILGLNLLDDMMASKFHNALMDLHKNRFVARQIANKTNKERNSDKITKWILLPIISSYLQKHWPIYRQYWNDEASYLTGFIEAYADTPQKIAPHFNRILNVINWCYENKSWNSLISLGVSTAKIVEKMIDANQLKDLSLVSVIDVCKRTAETLEKQGESENWTFLIKVLLILAKLYSSKSLSADQIIARDYALKALDLASMKESSEDEFDAIVLISERHIYLGELGKAENLLHQVYENKGIKENWVVTAFLLATIFRGDNENNADKSYLWYKKIIDSVSSHKRIDIALQSAIDVSKYCGQVVSSEEILNLLIVATELIKQKRDYSRKYPFLAIQVLTHCAVAYERQKNFVLYAELLQKAKQYCKEFGFEKHPIFNSINNRLIYLSEKDRETTLLEELIMTTSQDSDFLYGFDDLFERCSLCKKQLNSAKVISCSSCSTKYHKHCLVDINLSSCPTCNTEIDLFKEE